MRATRRRQMATRRVIDPYRGPCEWPGMPEFVATVAMLAVVIVVTIMLFG